MLLLLLLLLEEISHPAADTAWPPAAAIKAGASQKHAVH
jgi:hypothetical protein